MSLFDSHEWWSVRLQGDGGAEEFDRGSLAVFNADNAADGALKIVTASLQGVLRVHRPSAGGFAPDDCLLEAQLEGPVLQLAPARAAGGGELLAVLFPRKFALLRLDAAGAHFLQITRVAEHALERTGANFAVGPFGGGAAGHDAACVQSFDGQLTVFEAGAATAACRLPNSLIPGPLCYSPATDSLVTCNAAFELESYRFASLAACSSSSGSGSSSLSGANGDGGGGGACLAPDWSVVLGEAAIDIVSLRTAQLPPTATAPDSSDSHSSFDASAGGVPVAAATAPPAGPARCELLVACERSLFVVAARGGKLLLQRRLEAQPASAWPYPLAPASASHPNAAAAAAAAAAAHDGLLVATHERGLYVYQGPCASSLAWAARLPLQPAALRVADIAGAHGAIVALSDAGRLSVCYLGTGPPCEAVACAAAAPAPDFAAMAEEHARLLARIAELDGDGGSSAKDDGCVATHDGAAATSSCLKLEAIVPSGLDASLSSSSSSSGHGAAGHPCAGTEPYAREEQRRVTVRLLLAHLGREGLRDVRLSASAAPPVAVSDPQLVVDHVPLAAAAAAGPNGTNGSYDGAQPPASALVRFSVCDDAACSSSDPSSNSAAALVPASCTACIVAAWDDPRSGEPRFAHLAVPLPLALFASAEPPARAAAHKLTIDTDRAAPPHMQDLFADLVAHAPPAAADALTRCRGANALGLRLAPAAGGALVSVLVSRTGGGRYRLHSDCFAALALVLEELLRRLAARYGLTAAAAGANGGNSGGGGETLTATLQEPLPVAEVAELAQAHILARAAERQLAAQLEARAAQLRAVQRRLLARFKDKTPAPLAELDTVLGETLDQLAGLADAAEAAQAVTRAAACSLSAGLRLLLLLARLNLRLSDTDAAALEHALNPAGVDRSGGGDAEVGWEEEAEAALTQLLRSTLAHNAKEAAVEVPPLASAAKDATRLQRLLTIVLDRLGGG